MCAHRGGLSAAAGAGQTAQTAAAAPAVSFNAYPITVRLGRGYASATERAQASATRRAFIAQAGDQYRTGGGIGSAGADFEIVPYHRSPNGLGIRSVNGRSRPVALTGANVDRWIANGATLIRRNGS